MSVFNLAQKRSFPPLCATFRSQFGVCLQKFWGSKVEQLIMFSWSTLKSIKIVLL
jgi:hypothetical protein